MTMWGKKARKWSRFDSRRRIVKIIPEWLEDQLAEELPLDANAKKLTFISFLRFMVLALTLHYRKPSTRRLARVSTRETVKILTGLDEISHTSLSNYLRTVSLEALQRILKHLVEVARTVAPKQSFRWGPLKVAETTTIEVSPKVIPWAAPNGDQNAVRLTLVMDPLTWTPREVIHSSETTNDNASFDKVVASLKRGDILMVDARYTKLQCFDAICATKAHFSANMTRSYRVVPLHERQLPTGTRATHQGWTVVRDYSA